MNTLFLHFNHNGTIRTGAIRVNGKKVPDMEIWEIWEMYQLLVTLGAHVIELSDPHGYCHMITY